MMLANLVVGLLLQAAPAPPADAELIAAARAASAPFQDRRAAIRAGYRRLGPETPEMGEHWINPIMIVESRYDPNRPAVLTYATIKGKPVLTGVAYALAMRAGEAPPPTGVSGTWHDHAASVFAELAHGDHAGHAAGARVVVMHAWVWVDNPAGVFADENWALPYLRIGRQPPQAIDPQAARAVALLHDGGMYYANLLRNLSGQDFTDELHQGAAQAAQAAPHELAMVWQETGRRIGLRLADATVTAQVARALGRPRGLLCTDGRKSNCAGDLRDERR